MFIEFLIPQVLYGPAIPCPMMYVISPRVTIGKNEYPIFAPKQDMNQGHLFASILAIAFVEAFSL